MAAIEPNIVPLAWFSLFWTLCCIGLLVLSGSFPLGVMLERARILGRPASVALALVNGALMCVLVGATVFYGFSELKVTSLIIVMGLAFLFAPATYEIWPERLRDGRAVLATLLVVQVATIAALYHVGAAVFAPLA
ncbi:hypothetical protein [Ancylobacter mangrovi]|uniref:hypothetical protein n=1 Tax=Ancylobacter mangrovi TaxID=2972472 RepID=UPI002162CC9C|nr:hypothetical protein [Ancylobacter mangrovi]MCS0505053.1 hypothetical protein [Ancylobacter mangrovi]